LPNSATPSNLNAIDFLADKDNPVINPIFKMLISGAIQNKVNMEGYV